MMKCSRIGVSLMGLFCLMHEARADNLTALQARGREVFYGNACYACHGVGLGQPGTAAIQARQGWTGPASLEQRLDLDGDLVRQVVRHGAANMPGFRKAEIPDSDLDALVAYLTRRPTIR